MILKKHPETADFFEKVSDVLGKPNEVRKSVRDDRVSLYYRDEPDVLGGKWVVVVVKQVEKYYISTVYATDKIKSGEVLWTRTK